jgi:hypothetical protein
MAHFYLLRISDDCIRHAPDGWKRDIGEAVLKVCLDVVHFANPDGTRRRDATVGNYGSCVAYCAEVDTSDTEVYLWSGNRLCAIREAGDGELHTVENIVSDERARRSRAEG